MLRLKRFVCACVVWLAAAAAGYANVSVKNGNFFIGYTDIAYQGGFELKIERVYNSKTPYKGMFGHGWGCEYEVYLTISADGSVYVHEYGGGAENVFRPEDFNPEEHEAAVMMIADAARASGNLKTQKETDSFLARLRTDATFRNDEWEKYKRLRLVAGRDLAVGSILRSDRYGYQYIRRVRDGFLRVFNNGRMETFNLEGRLTRIADKKSNFIDFTYDAGGRLQTVTDNFGRKVTFTFNQRGLVEKLEGDGNLIAAYSYNDLDDLISTRDVDGHVYTHEYDVIHNMTRIGYADKTTLELTYWGRDKFQNIRSIKDRDGTLTSYEYDYDPKDKGHYTARVIVKGSDNTPLSETLYEYFLKRDQAGGEWTARLITTVDGDRTDTEYNTAGLPLIIRNGGEETRFVYDDKGQVTRKETPTEITELKYDPRVDKVSRVQISSKTNPKRPPQWSEFSYDAAGNLIAAKNSDGKSLTLKYDDNGRISEVLNKDGTQLGFSYNISSKPTEIRVTKGEQVMRIKIAYKANGTEIDKVESPEGSKASMQVTTMFQELLEIIRPAGVSLSF